MCVRACWGGQEGKAGEAEEETGSVPSWREAQTKLLQAEKANINLRQRIHPGLSATPALVSRTDS